MKIETDEAKSYKYLGVIIRNNGTFTEHVSVARDKAIKAYYSPGLLSDSEKPRIVRIFPKNVFAHIRPNSTTNLKLCCGVCGGNEWPDFERIHLMACKFILGVYQTTASNAIYAELGRYH